MSLFQGMEFVHWSSRNLVHISVWKIHHLSSSSVLFEKSFIDTKLSWPETNDGLQWCPDKWNGDYVRKHGKLSQCKWPSELEGFLSCKCSSVVENLLCFGKPLGSMSCTSNNKWTTMVLFNLSTWKPLCLYPGTECTRHWGFTYIILGALVLSSWSGGLRNPDWSSSVLLDQWPPSIYYCAWSHWRMDRSCLQG